MERLRAGKGRGGRGRIQQLQGGSRRMACEGGTRRPFGRHHEETALAAGLHQRVHWQASYRLNHRAGTFGDAPQDGEQGPLRDGQASTQHLQPHIPTPSPRPAPSAMSPPISGVRLLRPSRFTGPRSPMQTRLAACFAPSRRSRGIQTPKPRCGCCPMCSFAPVSYASPNGRTSISTRRFGRSRRTRPRCAAFTASPFCPSAGGPRNYRA